MKTKPKHLNYAALALLAISISLPIQIMFLYGHPPTEIAAIAAKLSPLNWMMIFLGPFVAALIYRASPLCLIAAPSFGALVIYNNWFVSKVGHDFSPWMTGVGSFLFALALGGVFTREVRAIMVNPSRRWWLTPVRKEVEVQVRMRVLNGRYKSGREEFYTVTYDISESGAFIPFGRERGSVRELFAADTKEISIKNNPKSSKAEVPFSMRNLAVGTQCYICLNLKELAFVHCRAEIVRVTPSRGKYPAGVGIRFLGLSGQERRMIGSFMEDLEDSRQSEQADLETEIKKPSSGSIAA
jgi:hypothetical protein